jgi:predicted TIM-barrel enzyme
MLNFKNKPILGMIHLAGNEDAVARALTEIEILSACGVDGCIVENYHNGKEVVIEVMKALKDNRPENFEIGINILPNDYVDAFEITNLYGGSFIQLDYIAGKYEHQNEIGDEFNILHKHAFPHIQVLGGVWPKYYKPVGTSILANDLQQAIERTDAVVVTGAGTGKETPFGKVTTFKNLIGSHPLIVGAGLTTENVVEQLSIADGAIVGSCFKPGGVTTAKIQPQLVREFMEQVKLARK